MDKAVAIVLDSGGNADDVGDAILHAVQHGKLAEADALALVRRHRLGAAEGS